MNNKITLSILITTMNEGIQRVKNELLPQLIHVDEVIISHQITDPDIEPEKQNFPKNIIYVHMKDKGLSKNRNNALKYATSDICHICDDDLVYLEGFDKIILEAYKKTSADVLTFQAIDEQKKYHFTVKPGKYKISSVLNMYSCGVTFKRKTILQKNIKFNERFGLGTDLPVGEENIFLRDCQKRGLTMIHINKPIVFHPNESSGLKYNDQLILARMQALKYMYGSLFAFFSIFNMSIKHYTLYKEDYSILEFFYKNFKSLITKV